ncbi:hypothetical protein GCM10022223_25400 [Kineosporia mesophila]|uniref:Lipoprotein n=1 Tax=Kineosporia mesophila TaxID=566012 RepID=A0ABP6ZGY3_9ACTN|nr:hypothetical protein [Kineosporia mesophila]MCD5350575.1 hypothetical protein [Kineosporia mesophila]
MRRILSMGSTVAVLTLAVSGCSQAPEADMSTGAVAQVDAVSGTIALPLDEYLPTATQATVFTHAVDIKARECAKAQGIDFRVIMPDPQPVNNNYGVWRKSQAEKYGYGQPIPQTVPVDSQHNANLSEAEGKVVYDCMVKPEVSQVKYPGKLIKGDLPFLRTLTRVRSIDTKQGQEILKEWHNCLKENDIAAPSMPEEMTVYDWTPPNVGSMTPEERFQAALIDVACKDKVDLVQRLADIEAGQQKAVIDGHTAELAAFRDTWQRNLTAAQKVVDEFSGA